MQIDVVFEETGEHIDVRFHSLLRDPDAVRSVNGIKPDENGNVEIDAGNTIIGSGAPPFDPGNTEIEAGQFYYDQTKGHLWLCLQKCVEDSGNGAPPTDMIEWANLDWLNVKSVNGNYPDENGNVQIEVGGGAMTRYVIDIETGHYDDEGNEVLGYSGTFDDIVQHYEAGDEILLRSAYEGSTDVYAQLYEASFDGEDYNVFYFITYSRVGELEYYEIDRDFGFSGDYIQLNHEKTLGNISTALDHIIALQEDLIGGDGA